MLRNVNQMKNRQSITNGTPRFEKLYAALQDTIAMKRTWMVLITSDAMKIKVNTVVIQYYAFFDFH